MFSFKMALTVVGRSQQRSFICTIGQKLDGNCQWGNKEKIGFSVTIMATTWSTNSLTACVTKAMFFFAVDLRSYS